MSEFTDLHSVIEDAVSDAFQPEDTSTEVSSDDLGTVDTGTETPSEAPAEPLGGSESDEAASQGPEVPSPATGAQGAVQAPVDPKLGIASHTNGRENRIPYSRVQKIVAKAEKEATAPLQTKLAELEPKIQQYEAKLQEYTQFEQLVFGDGNQEQFLDRLSKTPQYAPFFQQVDALVQFYQQHAGAQGAGAAPAAPIQQSQTAETDAMPQPDVDDGQGGKQYSMEGVKALMEWNSRQTERMAVAKMQAEVEKTYGPLRQRFEAEQAIEALRPRVMKQMEEVKKWELFTENEQAIVDYMAKNPSASVETAYRMVVMPKLKASREDMRLQILKEVQKAPVSTTSLPTRAQRPAGDFAPAGTRSMEDVIAESVRLAGLK